MELWTRPETSLRFLHGDHEGGLLAGANDLGLLIHVGPDGEFYCLTTQDGLPSNTIDFAYVRIKMAIFGAAMSGHSDYVASDYNETEAAQRKV